ncbi:MAG: lysine 2,3-aminomutase [Planctomycetota bacterium]|nr:lysine 2,3-aminomutase [Planctomycetota bacterium]
MIDHTLHRVGPPTPRKLKPYTVNQLDSIPQLDCLSEEDRLAIRVVAQVLPFRVNDYIVNELIDWSRVPDDPIYRITFPQREMLDTAAFDELAGLLQREAPAELVAARVKEIRSGLNPHPADQQDLNIPTWNSERLEGIQHKYRETVLFFPSQGQTCHSFCTFCFRWAQFVGDRDLQIAGTSAQDLHQYLAARQEVSDLLVTGGDPMVMRTRLLAKFLEPLLEPSYDHIQSIRIGTKALTFWPHRFVSDADSDDLLRLFENLAAGGKQVAIMAHINHWRELETPIAREAIRRLRDVGVVLRGQAPLLAKINDSSNTWAQTWRTQVALGMVPYYMFVERDTGPRGYFEVPLARAAEIYRNAIRQVSGLARTARGPSMSAGPGKVEIQGVAEIQGQRVFVLRFIQARDADWVQRPFFAQYDSRAVWLDDLRPAFGEQQFFYEAEYERICAAGAGRRHTLRADDSDQEFRTREA